MGLAWLQAHPPPGPTFGPPAESVVSSAPPAARSAPAKPPTFRETWAPRLAEKIGRPLTTEEGMLLGKLSAAFHELKARGGLYKSWLHQNNLWPSAERPPGHDFERAFAGYWTRETAPADPWALWQYIAYDWQSAGRPLPEAFLPMTDTSRVRAAIDQVMIERELEIWRHSLRAFRAPDSKKAPSVTDELAKVSDLRIQLSARGDAEIQGFMRAPRSPRKTWRAVTAKWIKAFDQASATA